MRSPIFGPLENHTSLRKVLVADSCPFWVLSLSSRTLVGDTAEEQCRVDPPIFCAISEELGQDFIMGMGAAASVL